MRFKSEVVGGYQIFAVAGVNTVSFGIDFDPGQTDGLLGFAVEREDPKEAERYFMDGFKVFEALYPNPDPEQRVSTYDQPIQSFVWDDFTAKEDRGYVYRFYPLKGEPKNLDRSAAPIPIVVQTEPLYGQTHDVFFNRGVASSQAYVRRFGRRRPDKLPAAKRAEALQWLSRDLDEALLKFIGAARPGDALLGAFYEFRYPPVVAALSEALGRGVDVRLVLDSKDNAYIDKKGKPQKAFPAVENREAARNAGIPDAAIVWRERNPNAIAHNKFLVLVRGGTPAEVWTGSTNLSVGGIHGQTNVGHWVRDATVAARFRDYWTLLSTDPGKTEGDDRAAAMRAMSDLRTKVAGISPTPTDWRSLPDGVTPVFSPRPGREVLDMYAAILDEAEAQACITLAFGISDVFKSRLQNNTSASPLSFFLLEKEDRKKPNAKKPFIWLGARHNVYQAWGAYIADPVYRWTRETNARSLGLNTHVVYVHSKFLLQDPLGPRPLVVTGSANFSDASTNENDENMIMIRGDTRVADIYFTEFNRLFFHYYFRSIRETIERRKKAAAAAAAAAGSPPPTAAPSADATASYFLDPTSGWLSKYGPKSLKTKRVNVFVNMAGARQLDI